MLHRLWWCGKEAPRDGHSMQSPTLGVSVTALWSLVWRNHRTPFQALLVVGWSQISRRATPNGTGPGLKTHRETGHCSFGFFSSSFLCAHLAPVHCFLVLFFYGFVCLWWFQEAGDQPAVYQCDFACPMLSALTRVWQAEQAHPGQWAHFHLEGRGRELLLLWRAPLVQACLLGREMAMVTSTMVVPITLSGSAWEGRDEEAGQGMAA